MKVNDTSIWERQTEALKDLVEELKKQLLDIRPDITATIGKCEWPRVEAEQML